MSSSENAICSICLAPSSDNSCQQNLTTLHCNHTFHTNCVLPWVSQSKCCPLCRTPSSEQEIQMSEGSTCVLCHNTKTNLLLFEHIAGCTHRRCKDCNEKYWERPCCPICFPMYTPEGLLNNPTISLVAHIVLNIHDVRGMILNQPP